MSPFQKTTDVLKEISRKHRQKEKVVSKKDAVHRINYIVSTYIFTFFMTLIAVYDFKNNSSVIIPIVILACALTFLIFTYFLARKNIIYSFYKPASYIFMTLSVIFCIANACMIYYVAKFVE